MAALFNSFEHALSELVSVLMPWTPPLAGYIGFAPVLTELILQCFQRHTWKIARQLRVQCQGVGDLGEESVQARKIVVAPRLQLS